MRWLVHAGERRATNLKRLHETAPGISAWLLDNRPMHRAATPGCQATVFRSASLVARGASQFPDGSCQPEGPASRWQDRRRAPTERRAQRSPRVVHPRLRSHRRRDQVQVPGASEGGSAVPADGPPGPDPPTRPSHAPRDGIGTSQEHGPRRRTRGGSRDIIVAHHRRETCRRPGIRPRRPHRRSADQIAGP